MDNSTSNTADTMDRPMFTYEENGGKISTPKYNGIAFAGAIIGVGLAISYGVYRYKKYKNSQRVNTEREDNNEAINANNK